MIMKNQHHEKNDSGCKILNADDILSIVKMFDDLRSVKV